MHRRRLRLPPPGSPAVSAAVCIYLSLSPILHTAAAADPPPPPPLLRIRHRRGSASTAVAENLPQLPTPISDRSVKAAILVMDLGYWAVIVNDGLPSLLPEASLVDFYALSS
ncbi:uncharacterized protein LOC121780429 [Salvia splendens]|uniref:uncharacterized protein LOC121780429 n=1 Tax=Salvia splendens TaxID=180675 RepID=UPI001C277082|nr:uncharacterized protein LOC121780429 [Salvia splendens]